MSKIHTSICTDLIEKYDNISYLHVGPTGKTARMLDEIREFCRENYCKYVDRAYGWDHVEVTCCKMDGLGDPIGFDYCAYIRIPQATKNFTTVVKNKFIDDICGIIQRYNCEADVHDYSYLRDYADRRTFEVAFNIVDNDIEKTN